MQSIQTFIPSTEIIVKPQLPKITEPIKEDNLVSIRFNQNP